MSNIIDEKDMESQSKSNNEDQNKHREMSHGLENIDKHEDEDTKQWELSEVFEQGEPGRNHHNRPNRPLPTVFSSLIETENLLYINFIMLSYFCIFATL